MSTNLNILPKITKKDVITMLKIKGLYQKIIDEYISLSPSAKKALDEELGVTRLEFETEVTIETINYLVETLE